MAQSKKKIGDSGEDLAAKYLTLQGFKIIGRNLASRFGEIDLVAQKKDSLYFVEIRKRIGNKYGSALESISPQKINRIRKTAEILLTKNTHWQKMIPFFSVVAIDEDFDGNIKIEFLPDAFE